VLDFSPGSCSVSRMITNDVSDLKVILAIGHVDNLTSVKWPKAGTKTNGSKPRWTKLSYSTCIVFLKS